MRVIFATITVVLVLLITPIDKAAGEPSGEVHADQILIPGIYCYDYFFWGSGGFDTTLFPGTNPNASFMDPADLLNSKGQGQCSIYLVSGGADGNLLGPLFDGNKEVDYSTDSTKILPNPGIMFVDEENIDFQQFTSGDTVLYGGILPFVALPDGDLETEDSVFNEESFSFFLYFKTKF